MNLPDPAELGARLGEALEALEKIEVGDTMTPSDRQQLAGFLDRFAAKAQVEFLPALQTLAASPDPAARQSCELASRFFRRLAVLNAWTLKRQALGRDWLTRALELSSDGEFRRGVESDLAALADDELLADVYPLIRAGKIGPARTAVEALIQIETGPDRKRRLEAFLAEPRNFATPLKRTPPLATLNGVGTRLYGNREPRPDGTFIATLYIVILFIPVLPISAWLVRAQGEGWTFFAKVPLTRLQLWWRRLGLLLPALLLANVLVSAWLDGSDYARETRALRSARRELKSGDPVAALADAAALGGSESPGRAEEARLIVGAALQAALGQVIDVPAARRFLDTAAHTVIALGREDWMPGELPALLQTAVELLAPQSSSGPEIRELLQWGRAVSRDFKARSIEIAVRSADRVDDAALDVQTATWIFEEKRPAPPSLVTRLGRRLATRYPNWEEHAPSYLRIAPEAEARSLLLAYGERPWKGEAPAGPLSQLPGLPRPLALLLSADALAGIPERAAALEAVADPGDLEEPQRSWHVAGAARRLAEVHSRLHSDDPAGHPLAKARLWAVRAAEAVPNDVDLLTRALRLLIADGDFAGAIALGEKRKAVPQALPWLGIAYARAGRTEDAAKTLRPLVTEHLLPYLKAYAEWQGRAQALESQLYDQLRDGTAERAILSRLRGLQGPALQHEADAWVRSKLESDAVLAPLAREWRSRDHVHAAALELAMLELEAGRGLPPGEARNARLAEAERLFLELRKVDGDDPEQDLKLAQVYFWMGREKEGADLFAKLRSDADGDLLHRMGKVARELGQEDLGRELLEDAYAKLKDPERQEAAVTRALLSRDIDDRLEWLNRADGSRPFVRSEKSQAVGEDLIRKGDYAGAATHLKEARAYYRTVPETPTSLNNAAMIELELARATGDLAHAAEAQRLMRRTAELSENKAIVLGNHVWVLHMLGMGALAGDALRNEVLHELPEASWLAWVEPQPDRAAWAARCKAQPELRQAAELAAKSIILSPDRDDGYVAQIRYFQRTGDEPALRRLRESLEASPPGRSASVEASRKYQAGGIAPSDRKSLEERLPAGDARVEAARRAGHPATLAYALLARASQSLRAGHLGIPGKGLEEAIADVQEAARSFSGAEPARSLAEYYAIRLCRAYAATDSTFAAWMAASPDCAETILLDLYLRKTPDAAPALRKLPDFKPWQDAVGALLARKGFDVTTQILSDAAVAGHPRAEALRKELAADGIEHEVRRIYRRLNPQASTSVALAWLSAQARGDSVYAAAVAAEARSRKVLESFFGE